MLVIVILITANIFITQNISKCHFMENHDLNSLTILSSRFNIKAKDLKYIFDHICKDKHDSLLIDTTVNNKYRLRKNVYELIDY